MNRHNSHALQVLEFEPGTPGTTLISWNARHEIPESTCSPPRPDRLLEGDPQRPDPPDANAPLEDLSAACDPLVPAYSAMGSRVSF